QLVGHGERRERNRFVGASAERIGEAGVAAAQEDEFAGAAVAQLAQPTCEFRRSIWPAGGVQQDPACGGVGFDAGECGFLGLAEFSDADVGGAADASCVVFEEGTTFGAAGAVEEDEVEGHGCATSIITWWGVCREWRRKAAATWRPGVGGQRKRPSYSSPNFLRFSRRVLRLMPRISAAREIL